MNIFQISVFYINAVARLFYVVLYAISFLIAITITIICEKIVAIILCLCLNAVNMAL